MITPPFCFTATTIMFCVLFLTFVALCGGQPISDPAWEAYKTEFSKVYENEAEEEHRYAVWMNAVDENNIHNADYANTYTQGLNQFSDMTDDEFKATMLSSLVLPEGVWTSNWTAPSDVAVPADVDWVSRGYVTPVKNQGRCGSCYSFSATGALEGAWFKKTGKLVSLSEQQILDCSRGYGNHGCGGGFYESAWDFIHAYHGVQTEESYPYEHREWVCRFDPKKIAATVTSHRNLPAQDENALMQAVGTVGPVSIAVDASCRGFRSYRRGVYDREGCGAKQGDLNHAVLAVGYGSEGGLDYWIVKNSWGTRYGENGYIKVARNKGNMCGVAWRAAYPIV